MNGYTLMWMALTGLGLIGLFLIAQNGPTGLMRGTGLWMVEKANAIDDRWQRAREHQQAWLQRLAGGAE